MANKKRPVEKSEVGEAPHKLGELFYGLDLDEEQKQFRDAIWNPDVDIVFCNSVAGTGKSTVAIGTANLLVKYGRYKKIVYMVSPVQEERIGYRPGETEKKLAPYFAPLYDLAPTFDINPYTDINVCSDDPLEETTGYIDCVSNIFLRGRNIKADTVLILDEAQNCYKDELRTILTRIPDGAKVIVIGHTGQCDLYHHPENSGFAPYIRHFQDKDRCVICELKNNHRGWVSQWADKLQ